MDKEITNKNVEVSSLSLPPDVSYMPVVRAYVREVAQKAGLSQDDINKVVLATDEAATNVIKHALLPKNDGSFDIICELSSLKLTVIVKDKGLPFSPEKVEKYCIEKVLDGREPKGMGLFLMENSVDEFTFHNNGFQGKAVHLVKYLDQKHIENCVDSANLTPHEQPVESQTKPAKIPYRVEPLNCEDSIEISQCAYRTYGYNYLHEFIYYPERIVEMHKQGELISAVAVCEETGKIISHAALEVVSPKNLAELGVAFTHPDYRHQGCFNSISEYLMELAKKEEIKGVYAMAVTVHPFSQKTIIKIGFKECGILIGMAQTAMFKNSLEKGEQRESMVILFRNLSMPLNKPLYAPKNHKNILKEIYQNIEMPVKWEDAKSLDSIFFPREHSVIKTDMITTSGKTSIYIKEYGADILEVITHTLKNLNRSKMEAIYLHLDLCDPITSALVDDFEKMGFFFGGVLPSGEAQYLILQYLNDVHLDYEKICTVSDFATKLLSYVKTLDPSQNKNISST
jgi:anti-sigma regulatory factor (Ser/Thr protein kinase)/N-acetylglutamate synthase-like GNAT family acetyltransferase